MKIPKFAFALLILAVVVLASSLTVIGVAAHSSGKVLVLNVELSGRDHPAVFDTTRKGPQRWTIIGRMNHRLAGFQFELLARSGDRVELGFRSKANPLSADDHGMGLDEVRSQPESRYWFEPGQTLQIEMPGVGPLTVTGEWMDHTPVFYHNPALMGETMDPDAGELRLVSPLLLRNKREIAEVSDTTAKATAPNDAIQVYIPTQGRYLLSLEPMKGAVDANVRLNRITFELNGQENVFVSGAPVARAHTVWVLYEPDFRAPVPAFVSSAKLSVIAPEAVLSAAPPGK